MNHTLDPLFADALRRELITHVSRPPRRFRRRFTIGASALAAGAIAFGGMTAASGRDVADPPLGPPIVLNGVGPTNVILPSAPDGATYLRVELVCYEATRCNTPGGGVGNSEDRPPSVLWQRDALPLTDAFDPKNPQRLDPLDPVVGLPIDTDADAHWRLYATYTDRLNPRAVTLDDGRVLGIPDNASWPFPSLVPVVTDDGVAGYVDFAALMDTDAVGVRTPAATRPRDDRLPVYDVDGVTVVGEVSVDTPYRAD